MCVVSCAQSSRRAGEQATERAGQRSNRPRRRPAYHAIADTYVRDRIWAVRNSQLPTHTAGEVKGRAFPCGHHTARSAVRMLLEVHSAPSFPITNNSTGTALPTGLAPSGRRSASCTSRTSQSSAASPAWPPLRHQPVHKGRTYRTYSRNFLRVHTYCTHASRA